MADKFGEDYFYGGKESNYTNYENVDPSKAFRNVISFIENERLKGRFLDVGCAFGFLLREVSSFFDELYGFDISEFAINKAKQIIPRANLKILDLDKSLPYPDESFDCITALDVLEHTQNFKNNFEKIVNKLKISGCFIVSVPIDAWPRRLFGFLDKDKTHISILKEEDILQIVEEHELVIRSKKYFCPLPIFHKIPYIPAQIELILKKE